MLDISVLLSALLFLAGAVSWIRAEWWAGRIQPLASRDTIAELLRVLASPKFGLTDGEGQDLLDDYLPWCEIAALLDLPPTVPECRDPLDRPYLELAIGGRADALITGDADLLALEASVAVLILAPAALREWLPATGKASRKRGAAT